MTKTREYAHEYVGSLSLVTGLSRCPDGELNRAHVLNINTMGLLEIIEEKEADLDLMQRMIEDLHTINQPVGEDLKNRYENLKREIEELKKSI